MSGYPLDSFAIFKRSERISLIIPDREKATVAAWLKIHPGVKMVSRDRGGAYAEAAREAAPHAIQIADRFHLSQNVGDMVVRIMRRNYARVKELLDEFPQSAKPIDQSLPFQRHETDKQVSQQRRMAVYEHVISLISSRDTAQPK